MARKAEQVLLIAFTGGGSSTSVAVLPQIELVNSHDLGPVRRHSLGPTGKGWRAK